MRTRSALCGAVLLLFAMTTDAGEPPEQFRGSVLATAGVRAGERIDVVVHVDRFTSDETIHELAGVLVEQGENALLHEIQALPVVGWVEIGGALRTELKAVRSLGSGPVRQLRFLTTPAIRYDDLWQMTRSPDYNYGFVELVVDENGVGDGTIMPAAAIEISDGKIRITSLGTQPFRILQVSPEKFKDKSKAEEDPKE